MEQFVEARLEDGYLVVRLPLINPPVPSRTGRTLVIASTRGNVPTGVMIDGKVVKVGVNAYIQRV